jgi:hypothetical protein
MDDFPNAYDWDTDEESREALERLKRHRRQAKDLKEGDATLQSPADQAAIQDAIDDLDRVIAAMVASRGRRRDFQRRRLLPPD